jgi:hypothetical protein
VTEAGVAIETNALSTAEAVARARAAMLDASTQRWRAQLVIPKAVATPPVRAAAVAAPAPAAPAVAPVHAAPVAAAPIPEARVVGRPLFYAALCVMLTIAGIAAVWSANRIFAPEMYDQDGMVPAAYAFAHGQNYAVFDLNLNIRRLRDEHVARMSETPDVVILGASHWQEAYAGLVPHKRFYNSHVHRDYWEDMLGVVEIWVRHNRLPKQMIIAVRDKMFTPIDARKDFLWEPGIPYWRAMADRLGIEKEPWWQSLPYQRMRERLSLAMLYGNLTRWYNADERPHATGELNFKALDTLLPDGSILWSADHLKLFTPERTKRESEAFAAAAIDNPPMIEERGVDAFRKLLAFLKDRGVEVYLVHPPFNPQFYDRVQGSPYMEGLKKIEALAQNFAKEFGIKLIGSFNPHKVGCDVSMYIDAEHGNPECLQKIFDEFTKLDRGGKS